MTTMDMIKPSNENIAGMETWIFQGNPETFDITGAVTQLAELVWLVNQNRLKIHAGHRVLLWRSGREAGLLARCTVLSEPAAMNVPEEQRRFEVNPEKLRDSDTRCRLRIDCVFSPYIPKAILERDAQIKQLSILHNWRGTNFPVSREETTVIDELVGGRDAGDELPNPLTSEVKGRVWVYAPGEQARYWEEFYREGIMAIGWEIDDLRQYPNLEATANKLIELYKLEKYPVNNANACYEFAHIIRPGDRIFAKRSVMDVVGYGTVKGNYEYHPERPANKHVRTVKWERKGNWRCPRQIFPVKTLTDFTAATADVALLEELVEVREPEQPPIVSAPDYSITQALDGVAFDRDKFQKLIEDWRSERNLILQGPPGVGKTFLARKLAYALIGHELPSRVEVVQLHQSYSYEDFVQGYRPSKDGFECRDGVFVRFCRRASLDAQGGPYVFIIDEINRGNLSKIFGEVMVLIESDKRGSRHSVALTYSNEDEQFHVPENVYVLGMMNTADRSLALVDYALRRRFLFAALDPLFGTSALEELLVGRGTAISVVKEVGSRLAALNEDITADANLGAGFQVGHSYFCPVQGPLTPADYARAVEGKVLPLLREYWFDNPEKVEYWRERLGAKLPVGTAA